MAFGPIKKTQAIDISSRRAIKQSIKRHQRHLNKQEEASQESGTCQANQIGHRQGTDPRNECHATQIGQ
jgi:hypothetical protein